MSSAADDTLFQRWMREHDAHAFAEIVSRHSGMVYGVCRRILKNEADAEDVAQDCFIELAQTRRTVKRSLAGWLHALAASRSLDRIRADKRRLKRESHFVTESAPAAKADLEELWAEVDEAIAALPEHLREPIVYRFLENAPQEEVARRLGWSRTTIQRRLDEGIQQIRAILQQRGFVVPLVGIIAAFTAHTAEAAPAALVANLGKLALSGGAMSGAGGMAALTGGGSFAMVTKAAIGVGALVIAMGALWAGLAATKEKNDVRVASVSEQPAWQAKEQTQKAVPDADEKSVAIVADANTDSENTEVQAVAEGDEAPTNSGATATLRGRVVDSRGLPVGNGRVNIRGEEGQTTLFPEMDESGAFEVQGVPPGTYSFTEASYREDDSELWIGGLRVEPARQVVLEPGETKEEVVITLAKPVGQTTLKIRVMNEQGEPVSRAALEIMFSDSGSSGPETDQEGRYRRYHVPDWESEARVEVHHRDYETEEFVVPISDEEVELVVKQKVTRAFSLTVVDGKSGKPISGSEVREDGAWQPTQDGAIVFSELSAARHRFEARAQGYQSALGEFSLESEETAEGTIELFRPATVRLEFQIEDPMKGLLDEFDRSRTHIYVTATEKEQWIQGEAQWDGDYAVTQPIGAGQPSDVQLSVTAATHAEDWPESQTTIKVCGLVVAEGQEAKLYYTVGRGTCVLKIPKIEELSYFVYLTREGDRPGVKVENATYQGVSEERMIPANPANGMYVAGELYPGTYRLRYQRGPTSEEQLIAFTKENEEIVLDWE